jgi:hypothetical protein
VIKVTLGTTGALIAAAILSFAAYSFIVNRGTEAEDVVENAAGIWHISSSNVSAIEQKAGYEVALPSSTPNFLELQDTAAIADLGPSGMEVQFYWSIKDTEEGVMSLSQRKGTTNLVGSQPTTIAGKPGQIRILEPSELERPYTTIFLGWQDGETTYVLTGKISENLTESVLREIAGSVRVG